MSLNEMVWIGPKHTKTSDPHQQQIFCLAYSPKEASPLSVQPSCKQGPLCLSSDPFCLLKAETGTVALLLASQSTFRLRALFSPSTPSQPARLNSRQHSFGFIVQLWPESRPKLAGSVEDQHRPIQLHTTYLSSFWEPVTQT